MKKTLTLNNSWDICLDENGKIAISDGAYAIAQSAANAVRLFTDDAYFDRDKGIPHFDIELGHYPEGARSTLYNRITQAVMEVEGVEDCEVELEYDAATRTFGGEITITTADSSNIRIEL